MSEVNAYAVFEKDENLDVNNMSYNCKLNKKLSSIYFC